MARLLPLLTLALLLLSAAPAAPARAQAQPAAITIAARAGYDGAYRAGEWFPVVVDVANDGPDMRGDLEWQLPGQRGEPSFRYPVDLPRGSRKRVLLSAFSRGFARSGQVRLLEGDVAVADQSVSLEPIDLDRFVVGVVSSDPTLLNALDSLSLGGAGGTVVRHLQAADLPEQAMALRGLNAIFLHDADTAQMTAGQREALRLWAELGGQLVVGGGVNGQRVAGGLDGMLPAAVGGGVSDGDIGPLLRLGQGALPSGATRAPLSQLSPRQGAADLTGGAGLIVRSQYGVGTVSVAAFDLALLRGWAGEPSVWGAVLGPVPLFAPGSSSRNSQASLLQTVLQLPGLGLPSAGTLLAFLLGYIAVIGPINYVVLRRLRRLEWAWLSVPLVVLVFAGGLYLVGFGLRGSQSLLSQVTVVQGSEGQQSGLATGFVALFSPRRASYTVGFPAGALIHETRGPDDVGERVSPVVVGDGGVELRDMLVDIASVRTLVAEQAVAVPALVSSRVELVGSGARGEIRNTGGGALQNVLVVRGGSFVDLGELPAGAARSFDFASSSRNFPWGVSLPEEGLFNRKTLVNTLFSGDSTLYSNGSGPLGDAGVYVLAWSAQPGVPVQVDGREQPQSGYTLYVIRLRG